MGTSRIDPSGHDFPCLEAEGWRETSEADPQYNCIAWAAGESDRWWWPGSPSIAFWPDELDHEPSVSTFEHVFALRGYRRCASAELEPGFEKVAFYAKEGEVTHTARQLPNGRWTSKLGKNIDIEHTLYGLEGPLYGVVVSFMRRERPTIQGTDDAHQL